MDNEGVIDPDTDVPLNMEDFDNIEVKWLAAHIYSDYSSW